MSGRDGRESAPDEAREASSPLPQHPSGEPLASFEATLDALASRGRPLTTSDVTRLKAEHWHEVSIAGTRAPWRRITLNLLPVRLRRFGMRLRYILAPRIGRLRHYPPRPLSVPASYSGHWPPVRRLTISVVTPCFQHRAFLERTLVSVFAQGYPSLEYFVQDGASTDETMVILERHAARLTGWISEQDTGQADAINRAFAHTHGEIMGWLNSDDLLLPGALAYIGRYFATHPDVDVVYGNRVMIDDQDGEIGRWILPRHDDHVLALADFVPQETLYWRRRIWDAAGGCLDTSYGYALDWELLLRFREAGARMVRLPRFLGAFRIHDEQKTSASHATGLRESARLRERVHGRSVPIEEVYERLRPYNRRHTVLHLRHRLRDRLPHQRVAVCVDLPVAIPPQRAERRG